MFLPCGAACVCGDAREHGAHVLIRVVVTARKVGADDALAPRDLAPMELGRYEVLCVCPPWCQCADERVAWRAAPLRRAEAVAAFSARAKEKGAAEPRAREVV